MVCFNQVDQTGVKHRFDGVSDNVAIICFGVIDPIVKFIFAHQVAGIWKGGYPFVVNQHRVPTNMVYMQVCAQNRIDLVAVIACLLKIFEEGQL